MLRDSNEIVRMAAGVAFVKNAKSEDWDKIKDSKT